MYIVSFNAFPSRKSGFFKSFVRFSSNFTTDGTEEHVAFVFKATKLFTNLHYTNQYTGAFETIKAGETYFCEMMHGGVFITPEKDRLGNLNKTYAGLLNYYEVKDVDILELYNDIKKTLSISPKYTNILAFYSAQNHTVLGKVIRFLFGRWIYRQDLQFCSALIFVLLIKTSKEFNSYISTTFFHTEKLDYKNAEDFKLIKEMAMETDPKELIDYAKEIGVELKKQIPINAG